MIMKTMLISGGIAGLVGIGPLLGDPQFHRYTEQFPTHARASRGIAIALVGRNHPVGIAFAALLFACIERATQVLSLQGIPHEIAKIMQGTIILSAVVAYEIVRRVRVAAEVRDAAAKAEPRADGRRPSPSRCRHEHRRASRSARPAKPTRPHCPSCRGCGTALLAFARLRRARRSCARRHRRERPHVERHVRRGAAARRARSGWPGSAVCTPSAPAS